MSAKDVEAVKRMVEPFAEMAGWAFKGRVMGLITEKNLIQAYRRLGGAEGAKGVRAKFAEAAEAIVRIGQADDKNPIKTGEVR